MSIIYTILSLLFLTSTISASVGHVAPRDVYSASFYNKQNSPISCTIDWSTPADDQQLEHSEFTVDSKQHYFIDEKIISMGSWEARGAIKTITCGGQLTLNAPFDGVTSPTTNWKFFIYPNEIVSGQPNSNNDNNY